MELGLVERQVQVVKEPWGAVEMAIWQFAVIDGASRW